jgi:flagellar basal body P-ring formation protein FlgA
MGFMLWVLAMSVRAEPLPDPAFELAASATTWIARDQNWPLADIQVRPPDRRAVIPECRQSVQFSWPFAGNTRTLEATCAEPVWKYFLQVRFEPGDIALTPNRDLPVGHRLEPGDLSPTSVPKAQAAYFQDVTALIGQVLRQPVKQGIPLTQDDLVLVSQRFQTQRTYRAGEVVELAELTVSLGEPKHAEQLTNWPLGQLIARKDLSNGHYLSESDLDAATSVVVATTNIIRNQVITEAMVEIKPLPLRNMNQSALNQLGAAIGFEATRTLKVGTIITASDLKPADLVRKGESVTLTIVRGALRLTVDTIALEDAKLGEQVPLMNKDSGTEIRGIVTGRNQARGL